MEEPIYYNTYGGCSSSSKPTHKSWYQGQGFKLQLPCGFVIILDIEENYGQMQPQLPLQCVCTKPKILKLSEISELECLLNHNQDNKFGYRARHYMQN